MITFTADIKIPKLNQLKANFQKAPQIVFKRMTEAINRSALVITTNVKDKTPHKTGNLQTSIRPAFSPLQAIISPHQPYAFYVHQGTGIFVGHKMWKGKIPDVGWRWIKGQRGVPYMELGLKESEREVNKVFNDKVNQALEEIAKI